MSAWDELKKANPQALKRPLLMLQYVLTRTLMSADVTRSSTTLTSLGDLGINVDGGKRYLFWIALVANASVGDEGVKVDLAGGSATMDLVRATYEFKDTAVVRVMQSRALNSVANLEYIDTSVTATAGDCLIEITGGFKVGASGGGTFIPRVAQNSHVSGSLTVNELSSILVQEAT